MSNPLYQVVVRQLEAVLAPRIVSRSLQEGLRQVGRSPDTVDYGTIERIMKAQVYRQLQVSMPVTDAKQTVAAILDRIREAEGTTVASPEEAAATGLERQGEALAGLLAALKPFNMYFEWPEVQKLRAQVQLLESEQDAGREATSLLGDATAQLGIVEQKLEDQLVIQARDLGDLVDAMEVVRSVGGPKVRRLENLLNHVREAQENRQLAQAEVERGRRLARDLRKLMESSVYREESEGPSPSAALLLDDDVQADGLIDVDGEEEELLSIDTAGLAPEVSARLLLLDLEGERHDVETLLSDNATLLSYRPDLREHADALLARLADDESVAEAIKAIGVSFSEAFETLRSELREELSGIDADLEGIRPEVDTSELHQGLRVALGILSTTLPSQSDVAHLRNLHQLVIEQAQAFERAEAEDRTRLESQLKDQAALLERLQSTLLRYESNPAAEDEYARLRAEVEALRDAHTQQTLVPGILEKVRLAEASLESAIASGASDQLERQRATLRTLLAQVNGLPAPDTVASRISGIALEIERQLERLASGPIEDAEIDAVEGIVRALKDDTRASLRRKLDVLTEQAAEIDDAALLERLRSAVEALDDYTYPDLAALRSATTQARDLQRSEQVGELHKLESEAARFAGSESPAYRGLLERLAEARERVEDGKLAVNLPHAWELLDRVEAETQARLGSVKSRLATALDRFHRVEKLNSDDVASVRRILTHLDSQSDAFERVSVGLRLQLEASLREAESLLDKLQEEYEATRVIADQLVNANVLDDVFGFLGEAETDGPPDLTELLGAYRDESEVVGAVVLDPQGNLLHGGDRSKLSGDLPDDLQGVVQGDGVAAVRLHAVAVEVAAQLGGGRPSVLSLEYPGGALLAAWPTGEATVLVVLRSGADLALLGGRLRRDLEAFEAALGAAADAATPS